MKLEFLDQVSDFGTQSDGVVVLFKAQAATYLVPRSLPRFDHLVMLLAGSWQRKEPVRVTVEGTDIVAVDPALSPKAEE